MTIVIDKDNFAIFFSRAPIPYKIKNDVEYTYLKHIGIYAYRRDFLLRVKEMDPIPLEEIESLEQLRFLYYGNKIKTLLTNYKSISVETPEDIKIAESLLA